MMIWYYACNTSTYDNDACNDKIFMMKNCLDIHNLIIHPLSWFWNRCKRKKNNKTVFFFSFWQWQRGRNIARSRCKIWKLTHCKRCKTCNLHIAIRSKNHELTQESYLAFAFKIFASLYVINLASYYLAYLKLDSLNVLSMM